MWNLTVEVHADPVTRQYCSRPARSVISLLRCHADPHAHRVVCPYACLPLRRHGCRTGTLAAVFAGLLDRPRFVAGPNIRQPCPTRVLGCPAS
jgi:hypothetical protein